MVREVSSIPDFTKTLQGYLSFPGAFSGSKSLEDFGSSLSEVGVIVLFCANVCMQIAAMCPLDVNT